MKGPKVEVKNLKHAEFASEETHCYQASIYVDGVRFCTGRNDGHGGPDFYEPLKGQTHAKLRADIEVLDARIGAANPDKHSGGERPDGSTWNYEPDFEVAVGHAINDALVAKDIKKATRRYICAILDDGKVYQWKKPGKPELVPTLKEKIVAHQKAEDLVVVAFIDELPIDEAVEYWRDAA